MKVVVTAAAAVPRWQADAVAALRARPELDVRVVRSPAAGAPRTGPLEARVAGPALTPVAPAFDEPAPGGDDAAGADVVLDLTGTLGETNARLGTWSFRLGDGGDDRLPFARAIAGGARTVTVDLVRRQGGARAILRRGRFPVTASYGATVRLALAEAARWPATLAGVADRVTLDTTPEPEPPRGTPLRGLRRLAFLAASPVRRAAGLLNGLVVVDQWNVGFAPGGARALLRGGPLGGVRWLPQPPARTFVADPFLVERDGVRALLIEDYDYARDRGVIDALTLDGERVVKRDRILELPTHLSYPYPLEVDGELYMVPENAAGGEVAAYRCVRFPDRWEREAALFAAFDGVDTTIFAHAGRWWAFCTRYARGSNVALFAYHAAGPRGPWTPHAQNPVVVDVGRARPAGPPFVVDGVLYRPGQDCSNTYGGAVVIARVDALDPLRYAETEVARVEAPHDGPYRDGLHTVSVRGDTILLDGKRRYRDLRYVTRLVRLVRARLGRRRSLGQESRKATGRA